MESAVSVSADGGKINIENKSPAALQADLDGSMKASVEPGSRAAVTMQDIPTEIVVRWENLWVSSTKNLETTHKLAAARTE
jgi:hypothetical protein